MAFFDICMGQGAAAHRKKKVLTAYYPVCTLEDIKIHNVV